MNFSLKNMNEKQIEAITTISGPLMIIAGAGSGKTRVLTNRIAYLIKEINVAEYNILAITFTNKAAKEMKTRIHSMIGDTSKNIWIHTFHSMCVRILRNHIDLLGYNKNFTILDLNDQKKIFKEILEKLNCSEDEFDIKKIANMISGFKNKNKTSKDLYNESKYGFMKTVSEIYYEYEKYLKKNNILDFDDLLMKTVKLFQNNKEILEKYQNKFNYIHVDEYQDTNYIQYSLIKMLSNKYKNVCIVGDDDQSIYSWRGADSNNIKYFEKDFPNVKTIFLEQNYRSTNTILGAANSIIKNNIFRKDKKLWSENNDSSKIEIYSAYNDIDEAEYVSRTINKLINKDIEYKDIAILYRANYLSRNIENSLLRNTIPYKLIGSLKFLQREEIRNMISYLNVLLNKNDEINLKKIINIPKRGIGNATISKLEQYAIDNNISFYQTLQEIEHINLSKKIKHNINSFVTLIDKFSEFENYKIDELIKNIFTESGYEDSLVQSTDEYSQNKIENISELINSAKQYIQNEENSSLIDFVSNMSLTSDSDDENKDNSVTLSTIHASKGLEYEVVFLIGMEESIFPSIRNADTTDEENKMLEEERRLAYVAVTRAKNKLFISHSNRRMQFGSEKFNEKSRFIKEIPLKYIKLKESSRNIIKKDANESINNFISRLSPKIKKHTDEKNTFNFSIDDRISHPKFGKGTILSINGDSITIKFQSYGEKTLLKQYAKISREE